MSHEKTYPFPHQNSSQSEGKDQSMEQIRELLFGRELQQISDRLQSLESGIGQLREELKKSHGNLETTIYNETTARNQAVNDMDHNLKTAISAFENQLSGLESKISGELDSMYSQLELKFSGDIETLRSQSEQRFSDTESQVNNKHHEISQALEAAMQRLQQEKADKNTVAALLESMAKAVREETE